MKQQNKEAAIQPVPNDALKSLRERGRVRYVWIPETVSLAGMECLTDGDYLPGCQLTQIVDVPCLRGTEERFTEEGRDAMLALTNQTRPDGGAVWVVKTSYAVIEDILQLHIERGAVYFEELTDVDERLVAQIENDLQMNQPQPDLLKYREFLEGYQAGSALERACHSRLLAAVRQAITHRTNLSLALEGEIRSGMASNVGRKSYTEAEEKYARSVGLTLPTREHGLRATTAAASASVAPVGAAATEMLVSVLSKQNEELVEQNLELQMQLEEQARAFEAQAKDIAEMKAMMAKLVKKS